jgi:hypothetical protein
VTILVGENSTGKTSFLAATRAAWDIAQGRTTVDFNEDPFQLGAFRTIANYRGGRAGRADSFTIGLEAPRLTVQGGVQDSSLTISADFESGGPQPVLANWLLRFGGYSVNIQYPTSGERSDALMKVSTPAVSFRMRVRGPADPFIALYQLTYLEHVAKMPEGDASALTKDLAFEGTFPDPTEISVLQGLGDSLREIRTRGVGRTRPLAIAPVRTRPKRTYDPVADTPSPEGEHVPLVLARVSALEPARWAVLSQSIVDFGRASGLFSDLTVKRLGSAENSPFQLAVKVGGPAVNLVDVGYGVSQVLPVLVDALNLPRNGTLLLQQPEVHLHPRAQAELATFLWTLAITQGKQVIIETHSDYLLDRMRLDVRKGRLEPSAVRILFFHRSGSEVQIAEMNIDEKGNVLGAPAGYRRFFMQEEREFWGE